MDEKLENLKKHIKERIKANEEAMNICSTDIPFRNRISAYKNILKWIEVN